MTESQEVVEAVWKYVIGQLSGVVSLSTGHHTPGPWRATTDIPGLEPSETYHYITGGSGNLDPDNEAFGGFWLSGYILPADARLMAAAPELLAALQTASKLIRIDRDNFLKAHRNPDGSLDEGEAAELADYNKALLQIGTAMAKATLGGAA